MGMKEDLGKALVELRKGKERKFEQTVDIIVNLQKYDIKKNAINVFTQLPHKIKDKKICAFLEVKSDKVHTITPDKFKSYHADASKMSKLAKDFDFFVAQASVMSKVATTFGRTLGPAGKMPSPQLGILMNVNDKDLDELLVKINNSVRIISKEPSIKLAIGKEKMSDSDIIENAMTVYNLLLKSLTRGKENVKNVEIKFTMTKPVKIGVR